MTYDQIIDEMDAALQGAGLHAAPDQKDDSLVGAGRGKFDGAYLIRNETGGRPFSELAISPTHWRARLRVEVATDLSTSIQEQTKIIEERARSVFRALFYPQVPISRHFFNRQEPQILPTQQGKRLVWALRFDARWTDTT